MNNLHSNVNKQRLKEKQDLIFEIEHEFLTRWTLL
jgi:hypothetical protein